MLRLLVAVAAICVVLAAATARAQSLPFDPAAVVAWREQVAPDGWLRAEAERRAADIRMRRTIVDARRPDDERTALEMAMRERSAAAQLRRRCVAEQNPRLCDSAAARYAEVARLYTAFLRRRPDAPDAEELRFELGRARSWAGDPEAAARAFVQVRDSPAAQPELRLHAARAAVTALECAVEVARNERSLRMRYEPPIAERGRVAPLAMPPLVRALVEARERVLAVHPGGAVDHDHYEQALLLYYYGHWEEARRRFARILDQKCHVDDTGRSAWLILNYMAAGLGDEGEVEGLARFLTERRCRFTTRPPPPTTDWGPARELMDAMGL